MTSILILNGPNLNLLGARQPDVYGKTTLADIETMCRDKAKSLGFGIAFDQSNHEGALIDHRYQPDSFDFELLLVFER